jgi:hypothetical protein
MRESDRFFDAAPTYHLLSAAALNSSRNRNFVHMKGERSGVVGPAFAGGTRQNSTRLLYR